MYHDFLILGGAGLVGTQVARHIVRTLSPRRIVIASLTREQAEKACARHTEEFGEEVCFLPAWGNLFVPNDLAELPPAAIRTDAKQRRRLLQALYGDHDATYQDNHLVHLIRHHRPEVIIDAVNTATGLSYQDVFDGAAKVQEWIGEDGFDGEGTGDLEVFLLSQSVPQLIQHVRILHRATQEYGTRVYLKVGTTGTGGMGLNIPYTHSEDRPSKKLLAKTEAAFGHTGLLFLMARTPDSPIIKEVKPAAMIGYRAVQVRDVSDKHGNSDLYDPRSVNLVEIDALELRDEESAYARTGPLRTAVVDTGENGVFTRGEFSAITALGQMEYITPEEIARTVVRELSGASTGKDTISSLDAAVLQPSYKAGLVRGVAMHDLTEVEAETLARGDGVPSIALGRLGPPELSKLLFEAALLEKLYPTMEAVVTDERGDVQIADAMQAALQSTHIAHLAPSIGIPVLLPDGKTLLRGPRINVPELIGHATAVTLSKGDVDVWANKGWVDLRAANVARWRARIKMMTKARTDLRELGSAAASRESYMRATLEPGEVVAWIFNNEMGGYRVK